jgi:hypothetical protein
VESRLLRYGAVTDLGPVPEQDLDLGTAWILDLDVRYRLTERGYVGFGIHNMLDDYADVRPRRESAPVSEPGAAVLRLRRVRLQRASSTCVWGWT